MDVSLKLILHSKSNSDLFEMLNRYTTDKTLIGKAIHESFKKGEDPEKVFKMIFDQYTDNEKAMRGIIPNALLEVIVEKMELL